MRFRLRLTLLLLSLLPAWTAEAGETLDSILARAAAQQQAAIEYREVRHLQLFNEPWQAEGTIYISPSIFVIEQRMPERQLLCADRSRLWLSIPERHIRRSMMLTTPMAQKRISLIRPLMHGDREALEKHFEISFSSADGQWRMELHPKEASQSAFQKIVVTGKEGEPAEEMKTEMGDGDYSEWSFLQREMSEGVIRKIEALSKEAKGI